jgi:hypothetical protein
MVTPEARDLLTASSLKTVFVFPFPRLATHGVGSEVEVEVQVHGVEFVKLLCVICGQTLCLSDFVFRGNRFWRIVTSDGVEPCHAKRFPHVRHLLSSGNLAVRVPDLVKQRRKRECKNGKKNHSMVLGKNV